MFSGSSSVHATAKDDGHAVPVVAPIDVPVVPPPGCWRPVAMRMAGVPVVLSPSAMPEELVPVTVGAAVVPTLVLLVAVIATAPISRQRQRAAAQQQSTQ